MEEGRLGIMMLPWLAHGHVARFLELAKKLVSLRPNIDVYIVASPIILASIKQYPCRIKLVELHLPSLPDLPPDSHTTKGLPHHLVPTLYQALSMASSEFLEILKKLSPDLLMFDLFQPWAPKLALSLQIPSVLFYISSALSAADGLTAMKNSDDEFKDAFPLRSNYVSDHGQLSPNRVFSWCLERSSATFLVSSFTEIEAESMNRVSQFTGKSVVPVGPLVPDDNDEIRDPENDDEKMIFNWLNRKDPLSVVFISFGSECYLSKTEIDELAHALLLLIGKTTLSTTISFIWVLRFLQGEEMETSEALPQGFAMAVGDRVHVAAGWAPQQRILRHGSIGGFVSHCGWNSVMEGMKYGVPIVAMPMRCEQSLNATLVEQVGVGIKVGKIERGEVAKVIEEVVLGNSLVRNKAKEIRDCLLEKGDRDIDQAIDHLVHLCETFSI